VPSRIDRPIHLLPVTKLLVGDVEVAESDRRPEGVERGAPVVFLHGLGGFLDNWVWTLPAVADAGRRALALDWPGFGQSEKPDVSYSPRFLAGTLRRYLDVKNIGRAVIVGNSMGGLVAKVFTELRPDRTAGLVLVDAAGVGPLFGPAMRFVMAAAQATFAERAWNRRFMARLLPFVIHQRHDELVQLLRLWSRSPVDGTADPRLRRTLARATRHVMMTRTLQQARSIRVPVAIAWGRHDALVPVEQARALAQAIPGARMHVFEHSGHVPMLEEPDAFNAWLLRELERMP
jgi:pimeloyl-ACP methyl ester carboxylesterase